MLARLACVAMLPGCFTPHTRAERPRVAVYNALVAVAGAAMFAVGVKLTRDAMHGEDEGLGGFVGVTILGGGATLGVLGVGGIAGTYLEEVP